MMALKLLPILQVIIILCSPTYSYATVYGTKRYGRLQRSNPTWTTNSPRPQPYQQMLRTQRYPMNYYDMYPYTPDDYYYPHEAVSYPVYYPRTSKYEVYQAVWPYYYDRPFMRTGYGYYGYDDSDTNMDMDEELIHEAEREQREDAQPIGQEMYYENADSNNMNDVNAAFLQNLIMSQMYKDQMDQQTDNGYGKMDDYSNHQHAKSDYYDDEDVMELKQLAKPKDITPEERLHWFQKGGNKNARKYYEDDYTDEMKRNIIDKHANLPSFTERKVTSKPTITTSAPKRDGRGGQKEEVLFRPATPVKHPFTAPILNNKKDRQRTPSVYDTIKHMLDMEKSLENADDVKPAMRKRIVASEDSLTQQLSVLKKQM